MQTLQPYLTQPTVYQALALYHELEQLVKKDNTTAYELHNLLVSSNILPVNSKVTGSTRQRKRQLLIMLYRVLVRQQPEAFVLGYQHRDVISLLGKWFSLQHYQWLHKAGYKELAHLETQKALRKWHWTFPKHLEKYNHFSTIRAFRSATECVRNFKPEAFRRLTSDNYRALQQAFPIASIITQSYYDVIDYVLAKEPLADKKVVPPPLIQRLRKLWEIWEGEFQKPVPWLGSIEKLPKWWLTVDWHKRSKLDDPPHFRLSLSILRAGIAIIQLGRYYRSLDEDFQAAWKWVIVTFLELDQFVKPQSSFSREKQALKFWIRFPRLRTILEHAQFVTLADFHQC